jgi:hypothetical protein
MVIIKVLSALTIRGSPVGGNSQKKRRHGHPKLSPHAGRVKGFISDLRLQGDPLGKPLVFLLSHNFYKKKKYCFSRKNS